MKKFKQFMLTAVIIGSVLTTATAAESFSVLLQKGIFAEETEGNLDAAIKIYEQITAEAATNHSVVAQAQYRLGVCYQKKGQKDQAVAALRRLMTAFPNEGTLNEKAQALLGELGYVPSENIVSRQLPMNGIWPTSVSPDGRWLGHRSDDDKEARLFDAVSGESRTVVKGNAGQSAPGDLVFSPDSRQVAYSSKTNLYITSIESPTPKRIYQVEKGWSVEPHDWSADGRSLVLTTSHPTNGVRVGLLTIGDGTFKELASLPEPDDEVWHCRLSASGDLLAFQRISTNWERAGIYVLSVQTGSQMKVTGNSYDQLVAWAPGTDKLVFIGDVAGAKRLWSLEFTGGKPVRDPELVKANVGGTIYPLGISTNGAIYYIAREVLMDVYLAEVDFETGKVASLPKRATQRFPGMNTRPIWSHDGRKLGFIRLSASGAPTLPDCFSVLTLDTGEQRDFSLAGKFISPIQGMDWSHDETFLLLRAYRTDADDGIYRFDLQAGKAEPLLTQKRPQAGGDWYSNPRFSPDGNSFYYGRRRFSSEWKWSDSIYRRHLGTGQNELVYESAESLDMWACPSDVSPDGKELAIVTYDGKTIKIVPVGGGDVRTLVTVPPPVELSEPRWTRDGRRVVFLKAPKENVTELWRIAAAGGDATRIDLQLSPVCNFSLSPDGRQIALQAGPRQGPHGWITPEVWVLENVLPRRVTAAK